MHDDEPKEVLTHESAYLAAANVIGRGMRILMEAAKVEDADKEHSFDVDSSHPYLQITPRVAAMRMAHHLWHETNPKRQSYSQHAPGCPNAALDGEPQEASLLCQVGDFTGTPAEVTANLYDHLNPQERLEFLTNIVGNADEESEGLIDAAAEQITGGAHVPFATGTMQSIAEFLQNSLKLPQKPVVVHDSLLIGVKKEDFTAYQEGKITIEEMLRRAQQVQMPDGSTLFEQTKPDSEVGQK